MNLDFIWMHGCIAGKINSILAGLNVKVGTFGLWRHNMPLILRITLYATLGFLLGEQDITVSQAPLDFVLILGNVMLIDYFAGQS
jgi:hypothetical protein